MTNPRPIPTEKIVLLEYFAAALINGDETGVQDEDRDELETISAYVGNRSAIDMEPPFVGYCEATGQYGDVSAFTFYTD